MRYRDPYRPPPRRTRHGSRDRDAGFPVLLFGPQESVASALAAVIGRWLFRHRTVFYPFLVMAAAIVVAAIAHTHHAGCWGWATAATVITTVILTTPFGTLRGKTRGKSRRHAAGRMAARTLGKIPGILSLTRPTERAYAAVVVTVTGGWLSAGIAVGPAVKPLPAVALIATVVCGVPWWVHHRRRARVRVERTIAAWPTIADGVGLPGSRVASIVVDTWGFTARLLLRKGTPVKQALDRIDAIESGLGARPGSVRILPDPIRADRVVLRVIDRDPHARPIPWPGIDTTSITRPLDIGLFEDGRIVRLLLLRRNTLIGGMVGAGKSGIVDVILAVLTACPDVIIWGIDLKGGMELQPWAACLQRLATTPTDATRLFTDAQAELDRRATRMAARGLRVWEPTQDEPALVIVVDEYAEMPENAHAAADSIARRGRAVAVNLLVATQRPTQDAMGHGAVRSQMDLRICLRVRERRDVDLILGQGSFAAGWHAHTLTQPGACLVSTPEHTTPERARAYLIDDPVINAHAARWAPDRPTLGTKPADGPSTPAERPHSPEPASSGTRQPTGPDDALWTALRDARDDGAGVADLMAATGWSRASLYRHLRAQERAGRVTRTVRGRWRATRPADGPARTRPPDRPHGPRHPPRT